MISLGTPIAHLEERHGAVEDDPNQRETEDHHMHYIQKQRDKNCLSRVTSKLEKGSLRSSFFTMFSGTAGAGLLSMPKILSYYGVLSSLGYLILFGLLTHRTYSILNDLAVQSGKKSYANLVSHYFGKKTARIVIQFMIFAMVCNGILYGSVTWQFLSSVMKNLDFIDFRYSDSDSKKIDQSDELTVKWRYICSAVLCLLGLPIFFQRSLTAQRYTAFVIMLVISYTVVLTFVQFPRYYKRLHREPGNNIEWYSKPFEIKWFQGWATMMLSYYCQILFFFVRAEMMSKTVKRISKLINALTVALTLFICSFACVGYMSLGDKFVPELFTLRREIDPESGDYFMKAAQIGFTLAAFLKISLVLYPAREQVYIFYRLPRTFGTHFTITLVMQVCAYGVPCVYPDVTNLLGLIGGIMAGTLGYSLPLLLMLVSLKDRKASLSFAFHALLFAAVMTIQCISTYVSVKES